MIYKFGIIAEDQDTHDDDSYFEKVPKACNMISLPNFGNLKKYISNTLHMSGEFIVECDEESSIHLTDPLWSERNLGTTYKAIGMGNVVGVLNDEYRKVTLIFIKKCDITYIGIGWVKWSVTKVNTNTTALEVGVGVISSSDMK